MQTTKINANFRLDKDLKESASELANKMWTNLSTVINIFLTKFVREKKLEISFDDSQIWESYKEAKKEFEEWKTKTILTIGS